MTDLKIYQSSPMRPEGYEREKERASLLSVSVKNTTFVRIAVRTV